MFRNPLHGPALATGDMQGCEGSYQMLWSRFQLHPLASNIRGNCLRAPTTSPAKSEKARTHSTDIPMVFKKVAQYTERAKPSL